jgi:TPP-dependent trihydroxycyclohexane-1,2-dione (THcHDO) dehydratase
MEEIRLMVAQALVRFLSAQYSESDGEEHGRCVRPVGHCCE